MANLPAVAEIDAANLPELSSERYDFVMFILAGDNQTAAYRKAFNPTDPQARWVQVQASKLRAHPDIAIWVSTLKRQAMQRGAVTLEGHLAELERLKQISIETGNLGAATLAEINRGKAAGVYLGDDSGKLAKVPAAQLIELVRQTLGGPVGDQAAQMLADKLGVTLLRQPLTIEHEAVDEAESA